MKRQIPWPMPPAPPEQAVVDLYERRLHCNAAVLAWQFILPTAVLLWLGWWLA